MSLPRDAAYGPRKHISIDRVRVSVEEVHGSGALGGRGRNGQENGERDGKISVRGRFEFDADNVSVQQVQLGGYPLTSVLNLNWCIETRHCIEKIL